MVGIYRMISPSGKVYIGQSWDSEKRFSNYKGLYCKTQIILYRSFLKYGVNNHIIEMIHELPADCRQEIMDSYEKFYIEQYKSSNIELMNLREGGSRGKHSLESIEKMKGKPRKFSKESREKTSQSLKNYNKTNNSPLCKRLVQQDPNTGSKTVWNSAREAARVLGFHVAGISRAAIGKNKRNLYKNYSWEFI